MIPAEELLEREGHIPPALDRKAAHRKELSTFDRAERRLVGICPSPKVGIAALTSGIVAVGMSAFMIAAGVRLPDRCKLAQAIAGNISARGVALHEGWTKPNGWKDKLLRPGSDNDTYKEPQESATEINLNRKHHNHSIKDLQVAGSSQLLNSVALSSYK